MMFQGGPRKSATLQGSLILGAMSHVDKVLKDEK